MARNHWADWTGWSAQRRMDRGTACLRVYAPRDECTTTTELLSPAPVPALSGFPLGRTSGSAFARSRRPRSSPRHRAHAGSRIRANAAGLHDRHRLLLKPLPVRDPGSLYVLGIQHEGNEEPHNVSWLATRTSRTRAARSGSRGLRRRLRRPEHRRSRRAHHGQLRHQRLFLDARRAPRSDACSSPAMRPVRVRSDRHPRAYLLEETLRCRSIRGRSRRHSEQHLVTVAHIIPSRSKRMYTLVSSTPPAASIKPSDACKNVITKPTSTRCT